MSTVSTTRHTSTSRCHSRLLRANRDSIVRRLNTQGALSWEGENWFVSKALAAGRIRVENAAGLLLVSYRHMYVREIDREQRCTRPLVPPLEVRA